MANIDTTYLEHCIATLVRAFNFYNRVEKNSIESDMYRCSCLKQFEIILEQSGKLTRKSLKPYFHSSKEVDKLYFKDIFRHCVLRSMMTLEECERWLQYSNICNDSDDSQETANYAETMDLIPAFIQDATNLVKMIQTQNTHRNAFV
jgi:hypothetical protein